MPLQAATEGDGTTRAAAVEGLPHVRNRRDLGGAGRLVQRAGRVAQRDARLTRGAVIAGIITIGILGLLSDAAFRLLYRVLFPYAERVSR